MNLRLLIFAAALPAVCAGEPAFRRWAPTPPMGWNSWDNFGTAVTEAEIRQQADYMARHLKAHGWHDIVVDIEWYQPTAQGHGYQPGAPLVLDGFGRLWPAANRFPSAAGGRGFRPLADAMHALGLGFGVHLLRGIPRQAVRENLPILGTDARARDIADVHSVCPWNPDMYGVDMSRAGAQAYYDSVFALLASWGVDFVKVDDISRPYDEHRAEIEAIRRAIDRTGRPMVLSLSPGATPLSAALHVRRQANMWRISDDFWDQWLLLRAQFGRLAAWSPFREKGAWPDADMLPLGRIDFDSRPSRLNPDEQRTLMTLWSIARSPLMDGGDLARMDPATLALLTNDEVLAVDQDSAGNRPLFDRDGLIAWTAAVPHSADRYLAVFNARDRIPLTPANARFASPPVTGDPASAVPVNIDVRGGRRLFLLATPTDPNAEGITAVWRRARFVCRDGSEQPLGAVPWLAADSLWDSAAIRRDAQGRPSGLAAQPAALITYAVPPAAIRFQATAVLECGSSAERSASVRFLAVVATAADDARPPALEVAVPLRSLGIAGPARIRDLWSHRDLGVFQRSFAPAIPFHGAGLYRLSP